MSNQENNEFKMVISIVESTKYLFKIYKVNIAPYTLKFAMTTSI